MNSYFTYKFETEDILYLMMVVEEDSLVDVEVDNVVGDSSKVWCWECWVL